MRHGEEFADPVLVPGPNLRSLHTDTEQVDGATTEMVDDDARFCTTCHRVFGSAALSCDHDGTALVDLPAADDPGAGDS